MNEIHSIKASLHQFTLDADALARKPVSDADLGVRRELAALQAHDLQRALQAMNRLYQRYGQ